MTQRQFDLLITELRRISFGDAVDGEPRYGAIESHTMKMCDRLTELNRNLDSIDDAIRDLVDCFKKSDDE